MFISLIRPSESILVRVCDVRSGIHSEQYTLDEDFKSLSYEGSGNVVAAIIAIPNYGCSLSDYNHFVHGKFAVVSRGVCSFQDKVSYYSRSRFVVYWINCC